jgi:hypothetical protein
MRKKNSVSPGTSDSTSEERQGGARGHTSPPVVTAVGRPGVGSAENAVLVGEPLIHLGAPVLMQQAPDLASEHLKWLLKQPKLTPAFQGQWCSSDQWDTIIREQDLVHYHSPLDHGRRVILWRFTSHPATETIQITAGKSLPDIISVIAAHSGGADKSNPDVKTSSLCRNPGALLGTAASTGGDKKVLNIINKAEYLYGIDVTSLAAHGVSAHPALARVISVIETEYVLVRTPGLPPLSIDQLATYKWPNPFKGRIPPDGKVANSGGVVLPIGEQQKGTYQAMYDEAPQAASQAVTNGAMDPGIAGRLLQFAVAASNAAGEQTQVIQMKEPADRDMLLRAAANNVAYLQKADPALIRSW